MVSEDLKAGFECVKNLSISRLGIAFGVFLLESGSDLICLLVSYESSVFVNRNLGRDASYLREVFCFQGLFP